jgi:hypothetical protein
MPVESYRKLTSRATDKPIAARAPTAAEKLPMDATSLMLSMLFGTCGLGFLMYGKKAGSVLPMGVGVALMVCPYFIPNVVVLLIVCLLLTAVPFVFRAA